MTALDWSARYLTLAAVSSVSTVVVLVVNSALVLAVALLTAVSFAVLALAHARRLRNHPLS